MKSIGKSIISNAERTISKMKFYENCKIVYIKDLKTIIVENENTFACEQFAEKNGIDLLISFDDRGEGWNIRRFFDNPKVDLLLLQDNMKVGFVHKNGFLAKTKEFIPLREVIELIESCILI